LPRLLLPALLALLLAMCAGPVPAQSKSKAAKKPTTSSKKTTTKKKAPARSSRSRGQAAPTADRIREIQEALAKAGTYSGQPTGKWDAATTAAMQKFQEQKNLRPTGKLDAQTLQQLGLGSPIAGLAPPRPAPGSSSPSNN